MKIVREYFNPKAKKIFMDFPGDPSWARFYKDNKRRIIETSEKIRVGESDIHGHKYDIYSFLEEKYKTEVDDVYFVFCDINYLTDEIFTIDNIRKKLLLPRKEIIIEIFEEYQSVSYT